MTERKWGILNSAGFTVYNRKSTHRRNFVISLTDKAAKKITITEKAAEKIKSLTEGEDSGKGLRIKIVGGGCSGLHYHMEIGTETERDKVFEEHGAKVIVDKKSFLYLVGCQVDHSDSLQSAGFVITNPNAKRTCGCGESFNV